MPSSPAKQNPQILHNPTHEARRRPANPRRITQKPPRCSPSSDLPHANKLLQLSLQSNYWVSSIWWPLVLWGRISHIPPFGWHLDTATLVSMFGSLAVTAKLAAKFAMAFPFTFHGINGVGHMIWDTGRGFQRTTITPSCNFPSRVPRVLVSLDSLHFQLIQAPGTPGPFLIPGAL